MTLEDLVRDCYRASAQRPDHTHRPTVAHGGPRGPTQDPCQASPCGSRRRIKGPDYTCSCKKHMRLSFQVVPRTEASRRGLVIKAWLPERIPPGHKLCARARSQRAFSGWQGE